MKDSTDPTTASRHKLPQVPKARLSGHEGPVQDIVWQQSSGKYCWTAGHDRTVRLWNPIRVDPDYVEKYHHRRRRRRKHATQKQGISTTSPMRQSGDIDSSMDYQDLPQALEIQKYTSGFAYEITSIDVASSSNADDDKPDLLLSACDKTLHIMDVVTAQPIRKMFGHHSGRINAVATHEQNLYLTASFDTTVALWDGRSRNGKPIQVLRDAKDSVTSLLVHADGGDSASTNIRSAAVDGCVRTYDLRYGQLLCDDVGSPITDMAITKDQQCLAASCLDGTIRLLDTSTGELLNKFHGGHMAGNYGLQVAILSNDATIVTGSEDGNVALYDLVRATFLTLDAAPTKRPTCTISAHPHESSVMISASYDNRVVVWSHHEDARWDDQLHEQVVE